MEFAPAFPTTFAISSPPPFIKAARTSPVWKWKDILKQRSKSAWLKKAQTGRNFMGKPSKYEKETIVNFNEGEKDITLVILEFYI